jgi:hypothetical protein
MFNLQKLMFRLKRDRKVIHVENDLNDNEDTKIVEIKDSKIKEYQQIIFLDYYTRKNKL